MGISKFYKKQWGILQSPCYGAISEVSNEMHPFQMEN